MYGNAGIAWKEHCGLTDIIEKDHLLESSIFSVVKFIGVFCGSVSTCRTCGLMPMGRISLDPQVISF